MWVSKGSHVWICTEIRGQPLMQLLRCPIGLLVSTFSVLELQGQPFDHTWVFSLWVPCIEFKSSCFLNEHFTNWAIFTASKHSILSSYKCLIDLSPKYPFKWRVVVLANSAIFYPKRQDLSDPRVCHRNPHMVRPWNLELWALIAFITHKEFISI